MTEPAMTATSTVRVAAAPRSSSSAAARAATVPKAVRVGPASSTVPAREKNRTRILDALFAVMSSSGGVGASVSEIAEAAGVARGALHYYFDSKDEVVAALMRRLGNGYIARLEAFVDREEQRGRTDGVVGAVARWHFVGDADEAERLLSVWIDFWGQATTQPAIGAVVFEVQERARTLCTRAVLLQRPELRMVDVDRQRLFGAAILAIIEGGLLQWRIAARAAAPLARAPLGAALADAALHTTNAFSAPEVR